MAEWNITPLERNHERSAFDCGKDSLNAFLRTLVSQYEKRGLGRTFVATEPDSTRVAGFYTLASQSIGVSILPESVRKKLPDHPVPVMHLGRLAVDQAYHGQRLGETLLFHALKAIIDLSKRTGVFAVDLRAIDEDAAAFYRKYGFIALEDSPHHLYLPMKTVKAMFDS